MSPLVWYVVKLIVLLPLVGGMAFAALWLYRRYQPGMMGGQSKRAIKLIDALPMGNTGRLAVVEFEGRRLLLSVTRGRIEKLCESDAHHG